MSFWVIVIGLLTLLKNFPLVLFLIWYLGLCYIGVWLYLLDFGFFWVLDFLVVIVVLAVLSNLGDSNWYCWASIDI